MGNQNWALEGGSLELGGTVAISGRWEVVQAKEGSMGRSAASLSPRERVNHYRQMAAEVLALAENCPSRDLKSTYLSLAMEWKTLADDSERQLERFPRLEPGADPARPRI